MFVVSDRGQDNILGILPFYHIYGMVVIMLNGLKGGAQIITLPKFEQDSFVKTLDTEKVINYLIRIQHLVLFTF